MVDGSAGARAANAVFGLCYGGQRRRSPQLQAEYADYIQWQSDRLTGEGTLRDLVYWREQLSGLEPLHLPTDRPRSAHGNVVGAVERFAIDAELLTQLQTAGTRGENATLFMLLLASFQTLLMRYTGQDDVAVGSPVAGRMRAEFDDVLGLFTNTLVLRTDLSGNPTFKELLTRVREMALHAYAHQEMPSDKLVAELGVQRDAGRNPDSTRSSLRCKISLETGLGLGELQATSVPVHGGSARADIWLALTESDGVLHGELEYSSDLFDAATIQRFCLSFSVLLLIGIAARPAARLS